MKYSFKLSKLNIIYASIITVLIILFNIRIYGLDSYIIGIILGSIIGTIIFSTLIALLFWFILGRKEKGGTTTFNIILTLMLFGMIGEFDQIVKVRQQPIKNLKNAISTYKENILKNPESTVTDYSELSTNVKKAIDDLIIVSIGEEKKVYLILKKYFDKSDKINIQWNVAFDAFAEPRILDFSKLNNKKEYEFQKKIVQDYIDKSKKFKKFVQNRIQYLKNQTKHIDKNHKAFNGFMKGFINKDSIQKSIFLPYINAHIEYGENIKQIIKLLEQENGKWKYDIETVIFQNSKSQVSYEKFINEATDNENIVNELSNKLVKIM